MWGRPIDLLPDGSGATCRTGIAMGGHSADAAGSDILPSLPHRTTAAI